MSSDSKFWDRIAEKYARKPVADEAAYQTKLQVTREYLRSDMDVFEFGCGTGSTAICHAPFVKHIRATDISPAMIGIARKKSAAAGITNADFDVAAIDSLVVPDQAYDVVMGHSILHLLADKDAAIAKVHAMLKPNGVFVSSTVCLGEGLKFFKLIGPIGRVLGILPRLAVFTVSELEDSLTNAGFDIDHLWRQGDGRNVFIVARKAG